MGSKMKRTHILLLCLLVLWAPAAVAQPDLTLTNEAIMLCKADRLQEARIKIEEATTSGSEAMEPYAWYTKGYILKEIFKKTDAEEKFSPNRDLAIEAINQCIKLDKTMQYRSDCNEVLRWLATTYLNHAMAEIELMTPERTGEPDTFYSKYSLLIRQVYPAYIAGPYDVDFYKKKAAALGKIYSRDPDKFQVFSENSINYYLKALDIDSLDYDSNYNLAVTYFNEGVRNIRMINFETDITEIIMVQDNCIRLFRKSEPYMQRANNLRPGRKETLKGMYYISRALNDEERANAYKAELERMFGNQ